MLALLGAPQGPTHTQFPCPLLPYYQGNKQNTQKSLLLASPSYLPWHAPMNPCQAKTENTGCPGVLSLAAPSTAAPNAVSSVAHDPTPTVLTGAGGNLGNRFQQKRVEQIENFLLPASQALHQGKEGKEALLIFHEPSFRGLIPLHPLCPLFCEEQNSGV